MDESEESRKTWWHTVPGNLTAIAGMITAITGLIVALHQSGLFGAGDTQPKVEATQDPNVSVPKLPEGSLSTKDAEVVAPSATSRSRLGNEVSTAQWIFEVINITETDEYTERYYQKERIIRPQGKNDTLIVVDARLKNRLRQTQSPVLTERKPGNTGLIDYEGRSYQPVDYDARQAEDKTQSFAGASVLPGAVMDFALVFSVPKGTKPKTLIFTAGNYLDSSSNKDLEVSLD